MINSFPGYEYVPKFGYPKNPENVKAYEEAEKAGKPMTGERRNMYRGIDLGFGGYVYAEPGMYGRSITLDCISQHPSSILAMNCFGEHTKNFKELKDARAAIKHGDLETAKKMMNGKLGKFLDDKTQAKNLSTALKTAINSVYGLTASSYDLPCRDPRNVNNIVALRGALFMKTLQDEVQKRGFTVVQIKTDSVKVANPNQEIYDFIMEFGKQYGYALEVEHVFEKICLVNKSVFIAKLAEDDPEAPGKWTATGKQFQIPYVFKTLFSKEPITFDDLCETKEVKTALYLDMNEGLPEGEHNYVFVGKVGQFCPIKSGFGGGELVAKRGDKFDAVEGTKGYRWLESETVKQLGKESDIDKNYYENLVDEAIASIEEFGDFETFKD